MKLEPKMCKCSQCRHNKRYRNNLRKHWIKKLREYNKKLCQWKESKFPYIARYTD
jgi:hypothetical protein